MSNLEALIRNASLARLANIFKISISEIKLDDRFGNNLIASFVSDFKRNELDQVNDDIHDVADRIIIEEFETGKLVIKTVQDYCNHMVRCNKTQPQEVKVLLLYDDNTIR